MQREDSRLLELDGLRGFAALSVFFSHAVGLYPDLPLKQALEGSPLHIIWDGAAAVFLFFTLSGFVLALPFLTTNKKLDLPSFVIRRVFRLYPAFWFALGFTMLLRVFYDPSSMAGLSRWGTSFWHHPVPLSELLRQMSMVVLGNPDAIDPPVWSLSVEMRASLILPLFIIWLAAWRGRLSQLLAVACAVAVTAFTNAINFLPVFVLGVVAAVNYRSWRELVGKASQPFRLCLWGLALVGYGSGQIFAAPPPVLKPYPIAVATILMILLSVTGTRSKGFLRSRLGIFLGETSYSFYLLHFPVLWVTTSLLLPATRSLPLCIMVALAASYLLSSFVYRWLEVPLHEMGRKVSLRLRPSRPAPVPTVQEESCLQGAE